MHEGGRQEELIDDNLLLYGKRYRLSERECEVLRYVLVGKDNQNIASAMHLALSTVKVHVHNILQKTGQPNRQALVQDFWKTS
ncbi:helix-turn-helix transcriptional regulator [Gordonibacter urolithinfaciens]